MEFLQSAVGGKSAASSSSTPNIDRRRRPSNEQEVFKQKKRLADAERKLKVKETKAALNERRVATSKIEASLERIALLNGTQPHEDDNRIFPMTYAPIILSATAAT